MSTESTHPANTAIDEFTLRLLSTGIQFYRSHQFESAVAAFSQLLDLQPDLIQANLMMGMAEYHLKRYDSARTHLATVLHQEPNHPGATETLANVEFYTENYETALPLFEQMIAASPNHADAHHRLSIIHFKAQRYAEALKHINHALALNSKSHVYWTNVMDMYQYEPHLRLDEGIIAKLIALLKEGEFFSPNIIRLSMRFSYESAPLNQLPLTQLLNTPLAHIDPDWFDAPMIEHMNSPIFIEMLQAMFISSPLLEYVYVGCRRFLLLHQNDLLSLQTTNPFLLSLISAMGIQALLADFAHISTEKEITALEALWTKLEHTSSFAAEDAALLALAACYRPLYKLANIQSIVTVFDQHPNPEFASLLITQVEEPLEEFAIMKEIPSLCPIADEVSQKVEAQYMEHPYPRWHFTQRTDPININQYIFQILPYLRDELPYLPAKRALDVLIAGCGTGKHPLTCVYSYNDINVVAIDLSKASMAYAIRKTREAKIDNIRYMQADILDLDQLDQHFDIVESGGVLHHMRDPMEGWRKITARLKPGGLMKIGLYSTTARKSIYEARAEIQTLNLASDENSMRAFRRAILELPDNHSMKRVIRLRDFFNLAECRDLLFHVQEHTFTIPQIKACIAELGLRFLGFEFLDYAILASFNKRFPNDPTAIRSLDAWHIFEQENPDTFKSMYQFWLRKDA